MISVLYVDDDPALLEIGHRFLERSGDWGVRTLTSAQEALDSPDLATYDAIISDYQMPGMNGIEFLKIVRERFGNIPFIIFTGRGREEVVIEAINNGADFYVQKGGDPTAQFADLTHKIRQAVDRRRTQDELRAAYEKITASEEELRENYDELSKSQDALRESEERYRAVFENTGTATVIIEPDRTISLANSRFEDLSGFSAAEIEGKKSWHEFVVPEDLPWMDNQHQLRREDPGTALTRYEFRFRPRSGEVRDILLVVGLIPGTQKSVASLMDITERKRAEKAATESNRRFAQVADTAGEWIWEVDADGRYTYCSPVVEKILGYKPEEIVGAYFYEYFEPGTREELKKAAFDIFKEKKEVRHFFNPNLHKDGHIVMLESSGSPVLDDDGTLLGYRGADLDVTGRMQTEKALKESRERYRLMLMNAKDGIMVNEFTGKGPGNFVEVNDAACRILEMTRDELRNVSLVDLDTKETKERAPGFIAELAKNRHAIFQIQYRPKTGGEKTLDISVSIFMLNDRPTMFSIVRDITGLVSTERALHESEEKFRGLVETSPDMIWEIDLEGRFRYISPTVETIMGYAPEELTGKMITTLVAEQGKALALRELEDHLASGQMGVRFEIPARHRDGHDMTVEIRSSLVTGRDGRLTGLMGVARDITDRRKAEDAVRRANRQLTLLGSITRHDALNKITAILGYLRIVSMKCSDTVAKEYLNKADSSVIALRSLIEFTRIYQDLGSHEPLWVELDAVMPRSQVPETVTFAADVRGIHVYADAMLGKVFANFLDNAIRHGEHVTGIRVSSRQEGTDLIVVWEDNGIGIAPADKERIFSRGYGKNTGIGLFLVREILGLTGIAIRETGVYGSGARFELVIPEGAYRLAGAPRG